MFGIMCMAIVVLSVVILFWLWCFPVGNNLFVEDSRDYVSAEEFLGDSVDIESTRVENN